jgi:hypothetical protein
MMQLQQFVTDVIEEFGGVVIPVEYALCQVLIPESFAPYFQHKTELQLSFDFEVAEENPDSEFVTFGSYILEQLLEIIHQQAVSTLRYAEVDRLELGNATKKISDYLQDEHGKITVTDEKRVIGAWAVFQYNIVYVADEKKESAEQVWINLLTNEISPIMKKEQNRIMYQHEPVYTYPIPTELNVSHAFTKATAYVTEWTEQQKHTAAESAAMEKDIDRITNYYAELVAENDKRINRKGLSEEKRKEYISKSEAIKLERDKQLQEIRNKYNGRVEVNIDNGIIYFIPLLEYKVQVVFRENVSERILYYNPIVKQFFEGDVQRDPVMNTVE